MRRTATAACLLLAGLVTGCFSGEQETAVSKPSVSASPSVDPAVAFMSSVEDARLASYTEGIPAYQELEVFPPEWCAALDEGHSVEWMLGDGDLYPVGLDWGTEKSDAYQLVLLGTKAYCPERADTVREELRASGAY